MAEKRFIVELGTGIDLHGQDATKAVCRAVKDDISRSCFCGLVEIVKLGDLNTMRVDVLAAVPMPAEVQADAVLSVIPFGQKELRVIEGGLRAPGMYQPELGDKSADVIVANVAMTVWVGLPEEPQDC
ncbi:MAG: Lin0512 family protein [Chloroflexota bacterium]|nr:Lin0512 family protein [Chloroflexota bacterium]